MKKITKDKQVNAVSEWWNLSRNDKKWGINYEDFPIHSSRYLISREEVVLQYLDKLNLKKESNVLELGYGAGQIALEIGKRGFHTFGLDISSKFQKTASKRCNTNYPSGRFDLRVGSIESKYDFRDNFFDVVVVVGALQYLFNPDDCFSEVNRVLKPGGYFIIAQRNIYSLSNFTSIRYFLRSLTQFFLREKYELFPSFKSILVDSKLGRVFGRYNDTKMFNTNIMIKGYDVWKYDIKKRTNSYFSLKKDLKRNGFTFLKMAGAYFAFSENPKYYNFNLKLDRFIQKYLKKIKIPLISTCGRSIVVLGRKNEK